MSMSKVSVHPPAAEEAFRLCRPPVSPLRFRQGLPLKPPSLAKALRCLPAPSNNDRPRPPPAGSRGPPREGPGTLFLTQACAPRRGSSCAATDPGARLPPVPASRRPQTPAAANRGPLARDPAGLANLQQLQLIVSTGNNFISLNSTHESST
ncbi:Cytoskeleton-Associated Protein 2-Like [Manis pentadactyla]|nr:Cytoskeleton-Associated Protein 2-Like [Manis pentadactyla]